MSICPFLSQGREQTDLIGCIVTWELRVNNHCAFNILAQKALQDAHKAPNPKDREAKGNAE